MTGCEKCGDKYSTSMVIHGRELWCRGCHEAARDKVTSTTMINPDGIPGGVEIKHGICNPDGSPKRYYSYSEMKEAAYQAGLFQGGDTPKVNPRVAERTLVERMRRRNEQT